MTLISMILLNLLFILQLTSSLYYVDCRNNDCSETKISCAFGTDCLVDCAFDSNACAEAVIMCPTDAKCTVECHSESACARTFIYAPDSESLSVSCGASDNACRKLDIVCPNKYNSCEINGNDQAEIDLITFFAKHGFNDIIFTDFNDLTRSKMNCGLKYNQTCDITKNDEQENSLFECQGYNGNHECDWTNATSTTATSTTSTSTTTTSTTSTTTTTSTSTSTSTTEMTSSTEAPIETTSSTSSEPSTTASTTETETTQTTTSDRDTTETTETTESTTTEHPIHETVMIRSTQNSINNVWNHSNATMENSKQPVNIRYDVQENVVVNLANLLYILIGTTFLLCIFCGLCLLAFTMRKKLDNQALQKIFKHPHSSIDQSSDSCTQTHTTTYDTHTQTTGRTTSTYDSHSVSSPTSSTSDSNSNRMNNRKWTTGTVWTNVMLLQSKIRDRLHSANFSKKHKSSNCTDTEQTNDQSEDSNYTTNSDDDEQDDDEDTDSDIDTETDAPTDDGYTITRKKNTDDTNASNETHNFQNHKNIHSLCIQENPLFPDDDEVVLGSEFGSPHGLANMKNMKKMNGFVAVTMGDGDDVTGDDEEYMNNTDCIDECKQDICNETQGIAHAINEYNCNKSLKEGHVYCHIYDDTLGDGSVYGSLPSQNVAKNAIIEESNSNDDENV